MADRFGRDYVRCIDNTPDGWVTLDFPSLGSVVMGLHLGGRYLASEAVVKQHPERFEPIAPPKAIEAL
jgi:hypothetical protein